MKRLTTLRLRFEANINAMKKGGLYNTSSCFVIDLNMNKIHLVSKNQ